MNTLKLAPMFRDPPLARFLFADRRAALLWLPLRLWLGTSWLDASLRKINDPKWVTTGESLKGFWLNAVKMPEGGRPAIAFDWFRDFLNYLLGIEAYTWFGKLIAYGEFLIGVGLIVGAFVGIAAFFGALMNWSFIMAGAASTNGLLIVAAIGLILAWKVAGLIGADYFLLRFIGVPWKVGDDTASTTSAYPKPSPRPG